MSNTPSLFRYTLVFLVLFAFEGKAQKPWSGVYGNEWLAGKYEQPWLRIGVNEKGIQKVTLPANFQNKLNQLHLYYRGMEIALISATNTEIEFYGVTNDGASDALLYRPYSGVKQNPYYSFYSDESSYFLTISPSAAKLAVKQNIHGATGAVEPYHLEREMKVYTESDTYAGADNYALHALDQSYLVEGKGRSSKAYFRRLGERPIGDPVFNFPFHLKNLIIDPNRSPVIETQLNGRTFSNNIIKASVGKTATTLNQFSGFIEFSEFITFNKQYSINASSDIDASGQGVFQLESTKITEQSGTTGIFSVNYIKLVYPQSFNMSGVTSKVFNLIASAAGTSNISVLNAPANAKIYDITDIANPRIITGTLNGTTLNAVIERKTNEELNLLVTNDIKSLASDKITSISFTSLNPANSDYLIISNEALWASANNYATYRKSPQGGGYRTLVVKIKDLYNQFNYGEPSPVAIRRFADYMINNAPREKHNLLLIGPSTTYSPKLILNRELKGDVPTIGFPGSDLLLVEGLTSGTADVPTIPIGRINATLPEQVEGYLSKVVYYEANTGNASWKKKVLHLNGGKTAGEITEFRTFLSGLVPIVEEGEVGGKVKAVVKQSTLPVEKANISTDVNEGIGMISYMGHGDPTVTDLDMGYISDAANSYQNFGRYPLLYFNGCGVGDIFNGRNNPSPTSSDRIPQSSDWINSRDKGGIAVIANSYYSFQASSSRYLRELYNSVFGSAGSAQLTIGQIQKSVTQRIKGQNINDYDIANLHQSLLQGDPALHLIRMTQPDFSTKVDEGIILSSESDDKTIGQSKSIRTGLIVSNEGKYIKDQMLPIQLVYNFSDGTSTTVNQTFPSVAFEDTLYIVTTNAKQLSKVTATIDSKNIIQELRKDNNFDELIVDWNQAKALKVYPSERIKDLIAPIINVTFNNVRLKNDEVVAPNPLIAISLTDNNSLVSDTTSIDIFLKSCGDSNCDFERVSYSKNQLESTVMENGSLKVYYLPEGLKDGTYELLVSGKDKSGNVTNNSYRVKFNVLVSQQIIDVVVSPNPASDYVHFELKNNTQNLKSIFCLLYDLNGRIVLEKEISSGASEWYWMPSNQPSGVYIYKIRLLENSGDEKSYSGKIALFR